MGKSSAPPPPDYTSAAKETAAGNLDYARATTRANRANMYTPFGSQTWTEGAPTRTFNQSRYDQAYKLAQEQALRGAQGGSWQGGVGDSSSPEWVPGVPGGAQQINMPNREDDQFYDLTPSDQWSSNISLDPKLQQMFDKGMGLQNQLVDQAGAKLATPFSLSGAPAGGTAYDPSKTSSEAYDLIMQRLAPTMQRDRDQMYSRLSNQGLTMGSEAYGNDVKLFDTKENDVRLGAMVNALDLGQRQQAQQFSQQEQTRADAIREMLMERTQPLNELGAVRSGTQVSLPNFGTAPTQGQVRGPDMMNAALNSYQGAINGFNAEQAQQAQTQSSIASIAAAMIMMSDIRIKHSIRKIGTLPNGLGVYHYFNMVRGMPEIGLIAQEVALVKPHAVRSIGGMLHVDYLAAME